MKYLDDTLRELFLNIDWFSQCGKPIQEPTTSFDIVRLHSWQDAMEAVSDREWEAVTLDARNNLTKFLFRYHLKKYSSTWNQIAYAANAFCQTDIYPKVEARLENVMKPKRVQMICADVRQTLRGAFHERFYRDLDPPPHIWFYSGLVQFIEAGHYPCGWQLPWPDGRLAVF